MRPRAVDRANPPPGPFRDDFWRSPLRGPWLTAVLGLVLLVGLPVVIVTGLLSNDAYQPGLGANGFGRNVGGPLDLYLFGWPTRPPWLYALTQGLHVAVGLALFPVLLAKLWSVIPRLFEWPPARSPAHALERLSLALLVGGALFEFVTGILNIQYWYAFQAFFVTAHYYGAWVFIAAFLAHVTLKFSTMRKSLKTRAEVSLAVAGTAVISEPDPWRYLARREIAGTREHVAASAARHGRRGVSPARAAGCRPIAGRAISRPGVPAPTRTRATGAARLPGQQDSGRRRDFSLGGRADWRLHLAGARTISLSRDQLLALPQHTYDLPIACVEGWSTTQRWSGVRLRDLASLCGVRGSARVFTASLERGTFGHATLGHEQVADDRSLLALRVNGLDLSLDHGYPARVISPAVPGVHCTKWVSNMIFHSVAQ